MSILLNAAFVSTAFSTIQNSSSLLNMEYKTVWDLSRVKWRQYHQQNFNHILCKGQTKFWERREAKLFYKFLPLYGILVEEYLYATVISGVLWIWISSTDPFFSLLFVLILFENSHQSSWWSTCSMLVYCNHAKSHMITNRKTGCMSHTVQSKSALVLSFLSWSLNWLTYCIAFTK